MNFTKKFRGREESLSLDITPLIDVVLQLVIFFVISTTFILSPGLKVDLPSSSANEDITQKPEDVIVVVTVNNEIMIGKDYYTGESLYERLSGLLKNNPEANLIIEADEEASHGAVVNVLDSAKRAGFGKLSIATERHEKK